MLNTDDEYGQKLAKVSKKRGSEVLTYGLTKGDFHAEKVDITPRGTRFDLITPEETIPCFLPLIGKVNVYNILAAAGAAYARNCKPDAIAKGIASSGPRAWPLRARGLQAALHRGGGLCPHRRRAAKSDCAGAGVRASGRDRRGE